MGVAQELETLSFFSKMRSLFILCLSNNIPLSTLPTIKNRTSSLTSNRTPVQDQGVTARNIPTIMKKDNLIAKLIDIHQLKLIDLLNVQAGPRTLAAIRDGCANLQHVVLQGCPSLQSNDLVLILSRAKNLKHFEVSAKNVEDVAHLSALDMDSVEWATMALDCFRCFVKVSQHQADVPHIKVAQCRNIPPI